MCLLLAATTHAQESNSVFNFLELPVSAHATALGGNNISLIADDASLIFANPALLSSVSDKSLSLNFMTYLQGCNVGSAAFVKLAGERGTWGVTAQYADYGKMDEITILKQTGNNEYLVDYRGVKCSAIFNWFNGTYYADDVYGRKEK